MELLQTCWSFIQTILTSLWALLEGAGLFVWDLLTILHGYPRIEGLVVGITLAWLMTRRDRHPLIKTLSAPLKIIIDILDLVWDHCAELISDIWNWHKGHWTKVGGWIAGVYGWCKSKVAGCWTWCLDGLKSIRSKLGKKAEGE